MSSNVSRWGKHIENTSALVPVRSHKEVMTAHFTKCHSRKGVRQSGLPMCKHLDHVTINFLQLNKFKTIGHVKHVSPYRNMISWWLKYQLGYREQSGRMLSMYITIASNFRPEPRHWNQIGREVGPPLFKVDTLWTERHEKRHGRMASNDWTRYKSKTWKGYRH